jgi:hypothetical protein
MEVFMIMEIAVGVLTVVVIYGAGLYSGLIWNRDSIAKAPRETEAMPCETACQLWDSWRQERCNAEAAAKAAQLKADALMKFYVALLAIATVLLVSASAQWQYLPYRLQQPR